MLEAQYPSQLVKKQMCEKYSKMMKEFRTKECWCVTSGLPWFYNVTTSK